MKVGVPFLQLPVAFDATVLAAEIEAIGARAWRPHPQGYRGNDAVSLISKDGDPANDQIAGPMRPTAHLKRCPYLQQVLAEIGATWGRSRLMRLSGRAEVTEHFDINYYWRERARVHVPIVTQPTVRFVCGGAQVNMRAGECWIFDTWSKHNVFNDDSLARIHLVADTVGGVGFWDLVARGRPHDRNLPGWTPRFCPPVAGPPPELDFESCNLPAVMSPWEMRAHYAFALQEALPHASLARVQQTLIEFARRWHALWSAFGEARAGWPRYRELLDTLDSDLVQAGARAVRLRNSASLYDALRAWIVEPALGDRRAAGDPEVRSATGPNRATSTVHRAPTVDPDRAFDRPVFIISPPRSGSTMLFETLAQARNVYTIGGESHQLIEGVRALSPQARGFDSNRLLAEDATDELAKVLRSRFFAALRDREQRRPDGATRVRMLEKTPKNALRIPFLAQVFPDARFIYLHRDPHQVLASMIEAWNSGGFRTYPQLPDWRGLPWSMLLVPGWRELIGRPLHEIVAVQWRTTVQLMLDDLERLPRGRWVVTSYDALLTDPQAEAGRVCAAHEIEWDRVIEGALPLASYTVSAPDPQKWRRHQSEIEAVMPSIADQLARAEALRAR
jgi:hypothetical protein